MADYTIKRIDEMEGAYGGAFKRARAELGVIDMPANFEHYPTHDHARDGQEEVFIALSGGGEIEIAGERHPLDTDHVVRVAAGTDRKVLPGPDGIRLLVLGAKPGAIYEAPAGSQLGAPDPVPIQQPAS
jgi:mannose-6-phosphate isomerase-like protein (cupin superfamily)